MGKILDIIINPHPILREKSAEVKLSEIKSPEFQDFLNDMEETMAVKDGAGLAAPQIGKNLRVFVYHTEDGNFCMINPVIIKKSFVRVWGEEGCLSVPDTFGEVRRHKKIKCNFIDRFGKKKKIEARDLIARVIQHEIDHLDGVLFIDKARDVKKEKS